MANQSRNQSFSGFKQRLFDILNQKTQVWWAEKIGISQSVISNSYYKGTFPRADKLMKIIQLSGVSANWLLFGKGAKYMDDIDEQAIDRQQDRKREQQVEILQIEAENQELKERIEALERLLEQSEARALMGAPGKLKADGNRHIFDQNIVPILTMFRLLNDIALKIIELHSKKNIDHQHFISLMKWMHDNFESKKLETIAKLSELETLFNPPASKR
jgi:transcriptional regulator with XRE-family HTH domain